MAIIVQLLNGTNQCRDSGFQAEKTAILEQGVRKNYLNELEVTTNQVDTGMCSLQVIRDAVSPNEIFIIPIWVTSPVVIDTSGTGYVIVRVDKTKVNDGSANLDDGTGIATIEAVTTLPIDDDYIILATLASGVITDVRDWLQISQNVLEDALYYDEDAQANDSYQITILGFKGYRDGQEYSCKANTTNTGPATLSINGMAAKSIRKNFNAVLADGDIMAGQIFSVRYDADNDFLQMQSVPATLPSSLVKASTAEAKAGTDDNNYMTPLKTLQEIAFWGDVYDGVLGDIFVSGDISANTNLAYLDPTTKKWKKLTAPALNDTQYYKLALITAAGGVDAIVKVMEKGSWPLTTTAINPNFVFNQTGFDNIVGNAVGASAISLVIDNTGLPECTSSGGVVSGKQVGAPSGAALIYLVLEQQEQANAPACFKDTAGNVIRGAIIATATIPQINFSGIYQDLAYSYGSNVKIPAGQKVYRVIAKGGAINVSNYYVFQTAAATQVLDESTQTWSGISRAGKATETIVSTPSVGYTVKAFTGSNGSYGLTPSNPWNRIIGYVSDVNNFFFDPNSNIEKVDQGNYILKPTQASGILKFTTNFCPSSVAVDVAWENIGTSVFTGIHKGFIRGDFNVLGISKFGVLGAGAPAGISTADSYAGALKDAAPGRIGTSNGKYPVAANFFLSTGNGQNHVYCVRMEDGFYIYNGYPARATAVSGGTTSFTETDVTYSIRAKAAT
ncbi:MAG: hypothetical protein V4549_03665 [Bacteroidota bacterium]